MSDKKQILLINRDRALLEQTSALLRQGGYTVHAETEMGGALTALSSHPVGLIICDKDLQDISGYDFLNFIKKDPLRAGISFIFYVSVTDQGRPFKAFELGATDFLVYPMNEQKFMERIKEILPLDDSSEAGAPQDIVPEVGGLELRPTEADLPPSDRRRNQRTSPLRGMEIHVSRDGVLWMPGRIRDFSQEGIQVETALFGKSGVSLMIRFNLADGNAIVMGQIKHVSFGDFQSPTGMGIEIEQDAVWQGILSTLNSFDSSAFSGTFTNRRGTLPPPAGTPDETVMLQSQPPESPSLYRAAMGSLSRGGSIRGGSLRGEVEPSYDDRFYDSLVGKQLDNYLIFTFLGSGSMGGVFQGWDIALEREVALKVISSKLSTQTTFCDMFVKEARMISKLDHPNIAHIYYVGNSDNILYYAMEFIDGDTLSGMIGSQRTINLTQGIDYLIKVCKALDFVSKKSIIHRDIKPENIMITSKGVIKILDFGVAKMTNRSSRATEDGSIVGSPLYMSPEASEGQPLDQRSDIYSTGATFYHAFTGHPPFQGDNISDILEQHQNRPLTPLREKNPKVPNVLGKIIEKMMAKNPHDRFQDYESIINVFRSIRFRALSRIQKL
jgi:CheY-like chemotaxis protein